MTKKTINHDILPSPTRYTDDGNPMFSLHDLLTQLAKSPEFRHLNEEELDEALRARLRALVEKKGPLLH